MRALSNPVFIASVALSLLAALSSVAACGGNVAGVSVPGPAPAPDVDAGPGTGPGSGTGTGPGSGVCPAGSPSGAYALSYCDSTGQIASYCCVDLCATPQTYCDLGGGACALGECPQPGPLLPDDASAPSPPTEVVDAAPPVPGPGPATDAGACPAGQYLLQPCCGGYNDTSCSNGSPPPQPFCVTLPASCDGHSMCTVGGCVGVVDATNLTLGCTCI
jgi:hypothetical protein